LLLLLLDVRVTLPPAQKVVGPLAVIVGVAGCVLAVTTTGAEVAVQPNPLLTCTVYDPEVVAVIACVVAPPGVQVFPVAALEVNVTLPPTQKLVGPLAVIVGVLGTGFTVTVTGTAVAELQPNAVAITV
jgi:hypothetical protein